MAFVKGRFSIGASALQLLTDESGKGELPNLLHLSIDTFLCQESFILRTGNIARITRGHGLTSHILPERQSLHISLD